MRGRHEAERKVSLWQDGWLAGWLAEANGEVLHLQLILSGRLDEEVAALDMSKGAGALFPVLVFGQP